jgi:hypothetical protein
VLALVKQRKSVRRDGASAVVLATAGITLVLALHLIAYRSLAGGNGAVITGRYLLPLVALFGLAVGIVIKSLPRPLAAPAGGVVVAVSVAMQFVAVGLVLERFYA